MPGCEEWGKEHSAASRPCVWNALLRIDYHSLMRQPTETILSVVERHLVDKQPIASHPLWPLKGLTPGDKLGMILVACAIANSASERCGRLKQRWKAMPLPSPSSPAGACGPPLGFDVKRLPYRWLPGLPVTRAPLSERDANARRLEVMHIADYWPGPLWLYHSPGSGVWWDPGPRRVVARNLVDALLKFRSMAEIVAHLKWVERGDRRVERFRAWFNWRVAYGSTPWEEVLAGAAAGNASFTPFASAGALLGMLLTESPPRNVDSIILKEQTHFWPRGREWRRGSLLPLVHGPQDCHCLAWLHDHACAHHTRTTPPHTPFALYMMACVASTLVAAAGWPTGDQYYAPMMVSPCDVEGPEGGGNRGGDGEWLPTGRMHVAPEMVDLRAMRENKRGERQWAALSRQRCYAQLHSLPPCCKVHL